MPSPVSPAPDVRSAGAIVGGKYRIVRSLGAGPSSGVAHARHLELDRDVVIRWLGSPLDRASIERFRHEARGAARLKSEHVSRVLDFGVLDDETPPRAPLCGRGRARPRARALPSKASAGDAAVSAAGAGATERLESGDVRRSRVGVPERGSAPWGVRAVRSRERAFGL